MWYSIIYKQPDFILQANSVALTNTFHSKFACISSWISNLFVYYKIPAQKSGHATRPVHLCCLFFAASFTEVHKTSATTVNKSRSAWQFHRLLRILCESIR